MQNKAPIPNVAWYVNIDVDRTNLQKRFFSTFVFDSPDELLAAVADMHFELDTIARSVDAKIYGADGWVYWLLFTKGYLQYAETETIGPGNVYYDYLVNHYMQHGHNPGMRSHLSDPVMARERVARRFRDFDLFRDFATQDTSPPSNVAPIRVTVSDPPPKLAYSFYEVGSDTPFLATAIDGWHRLCSARLCGIKTLRCEVVPENLHLKPPIRGAVEHFSFDGRKLVIHGWWLHVDEPIYNFEVRVDGARVARGIPTEGPDLEELFGQILHGKTSRFAVDCECSLPTDAPLRFDVVGMRDIFPVGVMSVHYLPGMFDERSWPPASLTQRLLDESEPAKLALRAVECVYKLLTPLARHRSLDSFTSVLNWGVGCGLLQFFLPQFLPTANVVGIDVDKDAVEWCKNSELPGKYTTVDAAPPTDLLHDTFDLVLGYSVLTYLTRDNQLAWLAELHRVVKPKGYLVVTVYGEGVRPFLSSHKVTSELETNGISNTTLDKGLWDPRKLRYNQGTYQTKAYALQEYSEWFDIVEYIEGGVDGMLDLIVMRKA